MNLEKRAIRGILYIRFVSLQARYLHVTQEQDQADNKIFQATQYQDHLIRSNVDTTPPLVSRGYLAKAGSNI
jgi:hypothetical protein